MRLSTGLPRPTDGPAPVPLRHVLTRRPGARVEHPPAAAAAANPAYHPLWGPLSASAPNVCLKSAAKAPQRRHLPPSPPGCLKAARPSSCPDRVSRDDPGATTPDQHHPRRRLAAAGSRHAPSAPLAGLRAASAASASWSSASLRRCRPGWRYASTTPRRAARRRHGLLHVRRHPQHIKGTRTPRQRADRRQLKSFRYRGDGWPGTARAVQHDGPKSRRSTTTAPGAQCSTGTCGSAARSALTALASSPTSFADAWWLQRRRLPDFAERDGVAHPQLHCPWRATRHPGPVAGVIATRRPARRRHRPYHAALPGQSQTDGPGPRHCHLARSAPSACYCASPCFCNTLNAKRSNG